MAGHGYIAIGLLSLLPGLVLAAYVGLSQRFRKGMPRWEAALCWSCMLAVLTFPVTCGTIGKHKRRTTIEKIIEAPLVQIEKQAESLVDGMDMGWILVQIHLFWIVLSFFIWHRSGGGAAPSSERSDKSR
eukprot:TRINITY_DN9974_c0_g1_i2.p1 TRINITY_DN9974_c0_g1~~TRINITY_DN9974_c0_g1_i2.p1  ORF type:complete len:141 (-),score=19.83 TRINITY_DN9974_c0_g1_i2:49-438(-)